MLSILLASGGGGGFTDVNLGLTVWTVVLFALFAAVLYKLGWKPILAMIEEREKRIVEAVESASKAQDEAQACWCSRRRSCARPASSASR